MTSLQKRNQSSSSWSHPSHSPLPRLLIKPHPLLPLLIQLPRLLLRPLQSPHSIRQLRTVLARLFRLIDDVFFQRGAGDVLGYDSGLEGSYLGLQAENVGVGVGSVVSSVGGSLVCHGKGVVRSKPGEARTFSYLGRPPDAFDSALHSRAHSSSYSYSNYIPPISTSYYTSLPERTHKGTPPAVVNPPTVVPPTVIRSIILTSSSRGIRSVITGLCHPNCVGGADWRERGALDGG